jgi:hypothetical protein
MSALPKTDVEVLDGLAGIIDELAAIRDLSIEDAAELVHRQHLRLNDKIDALRAAQTNAIAAELRTAAAQLREWLAEETVRLTADDEVVAIDPEVGVSILARVADLLDAEAVAAEKFPAISQVIFGAAITVRDMPLIFEAGNVEKDGKLVPVVQISPMAHILAIAEEINGLNDAAARDEAEADSA